MKPETALKNKVRDILKKVPNLWFVKTQQMALIGTPDFLCCLEGQFIAIELKKSPTDKPSPLQEYNLEKIEACGGIGLVMDPTNYKQLIKEYFGLVF